MLDCCENLYLGKFAHNEEKAFEDLVAALNGNYTFELSFLGVVRKITLPFSVDDVLTIPDYFILNEDAMYLMNVIDPDGEYITFGYQNCFTFKTYISLIDCDDCNDYIYGLDTESSISNDPSFELGLFD